MLAYIRSCLPRPRPRARALSLSCTRTHSHPDKGMPKKGGIISGITAQNAAAQLSHVLTHGQRVATSQQHGTGTDTSGLGQRGEIARGE